MWLHVFHCWMSTAFSGLRCVFGCIVPKWSLLSLLPFMGMLTSLFSQNTWITLHASRFLHGSCCIFFICNVVLAYPSGLRLMDCVVLRLPWCWCCCPHGSKVWEGKSCCFGNACADVGDKVLGLQEQAWKHCSFLHLCNWRRRYRKNGWLCVKWWGSLLQGARNSVSNYIEIITLSSIPLYHHIQGVHGVLWTPRNLEKKI